MFKEYLILLLLAHIIADFYTQTNEMSNRKEKSIKWVLIHGLSYFGTLSVITLPVMAKELTFGVFAASGLHLLADIIKHYYLVSRETDTRNVGLRERNAFFADQAFHVFTLILVAYYISGSGLTNQRWEYMNSFLLDYDVSALAVLTWLLALLTIHKPANLAIQKLLVMLKPERKEPEPLGGNNAGRFIGTIERIIMLILLSVDQYSAIGLVLTAKSIARYERISKEEDFAEYYLLGTLISTLIVIVVSLIL